MTTPLEQLEKICIEIFETWDRDQRPGKLLRALAGEVSNYRADVTEVRAALAAAPQADAPSSSQTTASSMRRTSERLATAEQGAGRSPIVEIIQRCDTWGDVNQDVQCGDYYVPVFFKKEADAEAFKVELMMVASGQLNYPATSSDDRTPARPSAVSPEPAEGELRKALEEIIRQHDNWTAEIEPAKARGFVFDDPLNDAIERARRALSLPAPAEKEAVTVTKRDGD